MTDERSLLIKPIVRLLFLGNPITDRRIKNFIAFFSELGFKVELIFAMPGSGKEGVKVHIKGIEIKRIPLRYSRGMKMFLQYDKLLRRELDTRPNCDILFACELYSLRSAAGEKIRRKTKQLFYDARELYTELPSVAKKRFKKRFWQRWEQKGLRQTDLVIVTAPADANAIKHVHGFLPPSVLIRNLPVKEELKPNSYLREYFSLPAEKKIFVYIGGLQKERGLSSMIAAIASLQNEAVFVMIGEGASENELRRQVITLKIQNTVFFHSPIDSDKVIDVLASADVGISLIEQHSKSYALALPSKIFEYMLAGVPVISSPLEQVKNLFDNREGMVFAHPDDHIELINACRTTMGWSDDLAFRKRIHIEAKRHFTFEIDALSLRSYLHHDPLFNI